VEAFVLLSAILVLILSVIVLGRVGPDSSGGCMGLKRNHTRGPRSPPAGGGGGGSCWLKPLSEMYSVVFF